MKLRWIIYTLAALLGSSSMAYPIELKDKTFTIENGGTVLFKHSQHLKKKNPKADNIGCKSCHNSKMKEHVRYTMSDMEKGKSCGLCHNGAKAFALEKCSRCHKVPDITFNRKETGITIFSHSRHLESMSCKSCHNKIYKPGASKKVGMAGMEHGKSCGACHDGKKAFPLNKCTGCHPTKDKRFRVAGAGNVAFSHQGHLENFGCKDCHPRPYQHGAKKPVAMADMKNGKSCGACHDGNTAFTVSANCGKCHKV